MTSLKRYFPEDLKKRNGTQKSTSDELISCSFTKAFIEKLENTMENGVNWMDEKDLKSKAGFVRNCVIFMIKEFRNIFDELPEILQFDYDKEDAYEMRKAKTVTVSMGNNDLGITGGDMVNEINSLLQKMNMMSTRSEFVRFAVLYYILISAKKDKEAKDISQIKHNGKMADIKQMKKLNTD